MGQSSTSWSAQITIQAVGVLPATPGVSVLIGRDILDHCRFVFDGAETRYTLWS